MVHTFLPRKNACALKDQLKDLIWWSSIDWALINTPLHQIKERPMLRQLLTKAVRGWEGAHAPDKFLNLCFNISQLCIFLNVSFSTIFLCGPICVEWFLLLLSTAATERGVSSVTKWQMLPPWVPGWPLAYITIYGKITSIKLLHAEWVADSDSDWDSFSPEILLEIPKLHLLVCAFDVVVSSDRNSYSDSVILLVRQQLFQILSISANIFSFSFWELNADW